MIFKLVKNTGPDKTGEIHGYDWIEVLAFVPMQLVQETHPDQIGKSQVRNWVICRTEHGLTRTSDDDLFYAIEELKEYVEAKEPFI